MNKIDEENQERERKMSKLDKLGSECMQLHSKIVAGARRIASDRKDYNERRKAITAELREKLTPVWAALKAGKSVNGQSTIEGWCRLANPSAKYPERQFQKIMSPKGEHSSPRPSPKELLKQLLDVIATAMPKDGTWDERSTIFFEAVTEKAADIADTIGRKFDKKASKKKKDPAVTPESIAIIKKSTQGAKPDLISVKLTSAQMREVENIPSSGEFKVKTQLRFPPATYHEKGKELILALEQRMETLKAEHKKWVEDNNITPYMMDWKNKDRDGMAAKKVCATYHGAMKACDGAIDKIGWGDLTNDEDGRDLMDWKTAHDEAVRSAVLKAQDAKIAHKFGKHNQTPDPACPLCKPTLDVLTDAPIVTQPDTHLFTGNAVETPICLMRAGKRAKRGERFTKAVGKPPTCKACLAAIEAAAFKSKADFKAAEDEFNARRQKEMESGYRPL